MLGQHLRLDLLDAEAMGHRFGGDPIVAGEHDDLDALLPQGAQRGGGARFDGIGDRDDPGGALVDADVDDGRTLGAQLIGAGGQLMGVDVMGGQEIRTAQDHGAALDHAKHTKPDGCVEVAHRGIVS